MVDSFVQALTAWHLVSAAAMEVTTKRGHPWEVLSLRVKSDIYVYVYSLSSPLQNPVSPMRFYQRALENDKTDSLFSGGQEKNDDMTT